MNDTNLISAETALKAPPALGNVRAGLAGYAEWSGSPPVLTDAVELIDQQAQRIADLEAERDEWKQNARPVPAQAHRDDQAVDNFACAMRRKLALARAKGRGGWDDPAQCGVETLARMLVEHVRKGDPVDMANFAMMLHQRGAGTAVLADAAAQAVPDGWRLVLTEARDLFAAYAESHRARGPEHAEKAARNEAMATKINAALASAPEHKA